MHRSAPSTKAFPCGAHIVRTWVGGRVCSTGKKTMAESKSLVFESADLSVRFGGFASWVWSMDSLFTEPYKSMMVPMSWLVLRKAVIWLLTATPPRGNSFITIFLLPVFFFRLPAIVYVVCCCTHGRCSRMMIGLTFALVRLTMPSFVGASLSLLRSLFQQAFLRFFKIHWLFGSFFAICCDWRCVMKMFGGWKANAPNVSCTHSSREHFRNNFWFSAPDSSLCTIIISLFMPIFCPIDQRETQHWPRTSSNNIMSINNNGRKQGRVVLLKKSMNNCIIL